MRDETARDGSAMLNSTSRPMDLVVTALVMLTMSGTLAEETQTRWPAVKLLSVSGFPRGDSLQTSGLVANVPVLHKPFTSDQIETTLRDVLDAWLPSASPIPSVRRPLDPLQVNAVLAFIASGAARNNQPIAGSERLLGNAIT